MFDFCYILAVAAFFLGYLAARLLDWWAGVDLPPQVIVYTVEHDE